MTDSVCGRLISDYVEIYMGPVFYYCLKRTGNAQMADDISQDIAQQILAALKGGIVPEHFPAWVWQIVRNRYSRWAAQKHRHSEFLVGPDIGDFDIEAEGSDPADKVVTGNQLALLKRELAFIKKDYREIIVAYYLEDKSVRDIAASLSLSDSAVKKRLERARTLLKEGMDMARTFGKLSYQPENITFINSGTFCSQTEPWIFYDSLLYKNIMLAAYRAPATAEELALEVGIALPYMEEALDKLTAATLMKKNGNKYETTFFIVSAAAQEKIYAYQKQIIFGLTNAVIRTLEYETMCKNRLCPGWHEGYQPFKDMKWSLLIEETDKVVYQLFKTFSDIQPLAPAKLGPHGYTIRPHDSEWDTLGMEIYSGDCPSFVGQHSCSPSPDRDAPEIHFSQFKFQYRGIEHKTPAMLSYAEGEALVAAAKGDTSGITPATLERLEEYGYLEKKSGTYRPTFLVMFEAKNPELPAPEREQLLTLRNEAEGIAKKHYLFCREQILRETPDFLKNDLFQIKHACKQILTTLRGAVLEEALRIGYISYAADDPRKMLGAVLKV